MSVGVEEGVSVLSLSSADWSSGLALGSSLSGAFSVPLDDSTLTAVWKVGERKREGERKKGTHDIETH